MGYGPPLVIISGLAATGKTRLARELAGILAWPCLSKDDFKEILFDHLGIDNADQVRLLGPTSFALLWHTMNTLLAAGNALVVETHFYHDLSTPRLRELCERYSARPVQIHLHVDEAVRQERSLARIASGERHPGHHAAPHGEPLPAQRPLELACPLLSLDTTDFSTLNVPKIVAFIQSHCPRLS